MWFIGWVLPYNCEGSVKNPSIWKESFTSIVPRIRIVRGRELGRVTYWLQIVRSWRRWTHRKSTRKDSMRKRWYFTKKKENLFFQSQMDEANPLEEVKIWEHPPRYGSDQFEETVTLIFLENQKGLFPPPQDSFLDAGEAINDFWSMSGNFIYRDHVEPRVKLYPSRKESFPIPLKYIDVSRTTHTNLDVKQETHRWFLEYRWVKRRAKSERSSFGRIVMGKAIWENPIAARLGKGFQLGMLIRTP